MTMNENCEQLKSLIKMRYSKEVEFFALPKTNNSKDLLENELALSLLQNKKLRSYFKADDLIVPIYRGTSLDGAVIIKAGDDLDRVSCMQITELVELLITDIMSLQDHENALKQTENQLEKQIRLTDVYVSNEAHSGVFH